MAKKNKELTEAEKALKQAQANYDKLRTQSTQKPDYDAQIQNTNVTYANKIRDLESKQKQLDTESHEAIDKLKSVYKYKKEDAVHDSIDQGIARSSIIKERLSGLDEEEQTEKKRKDDKTAYNLEKLRTQISDIEANRLTALEDITKKEQAWENSLKRKDEINNARYSLADAKEAYKVLQGEEKNAQKQTSKPVEDIDASRPNNISDKYWDRTKSMYSMLRDEDKDYITKYLEENAYRLRVNLGDQGWWWLEKKLGISKSPSQWR